jgi:acetyl-CoA/propionyl-CoA/long-chain acyl-CoA carboxylase, biotin carboxylase, biotin carboxyl carrier protein
LAPFERVLIANRGEIAVRVIRACRELGIVPVAVYGPGEENAQHVRLAGDAYRLDAGDRLPYLNIESIIAVALRAKCQAIHPGYGFLAEHCGFAEACSDAGIVFVGPSAKSIRSMGDKITARKIAIDAGVPVVPGSDGPVTSANEARAWAEQHGYPVAVKASAGGGGRGFRVAHAAAELDGAFAGSAGEAERYFANPEVYLELYLHEPRHIEVQVFADMYGNVVWLGERDCSIQRRHQKLIEETPSPGVGAGLRAALGEAAVGLARAVDYVGAGTVEFLVTPEGSFYFLEMNTRIQVEHTITEEVTGIDLVKEQLQVAAAKPLSFSQNDLEPRGHALQCRINAEDAGNDFKPTPGVLVEVRLPEGPGIRVDTAMASGSEIPPAYDSLIAKLVTWGRDRDESIARMRRALAELRIEGVPTTIPFHQRVMGHPVFIAGEATTTFLVEHPEVLPERAMSQTASPDSPGTPEDLVVEVNGRRLEVRIHGTMTPLTGSRPQPRSRPALSDRARAGSRHDGAGEIRSPLQGTVLRVGVEPGAIVSAGDLICVVEAMKMENEITAPRSGSITSVDVTPGSTVSVGSVVATLV